MSCLFNDLLPKNMSPEVGELRQFNILKRVDLPEPDGPNNATNSPCRISKEISWIIFNPSTEKPTFFILKVDCFVVDLLQYQFILFLLFDNTFQYTK